jgi:hypothetical protein
MNAFIVLKGRTKSMVLKLDLQKAYDCINWDLLRMILIQIGLGIDMTNWIMSFVRFFFLCCFIKWGGH